MRNLLLVLTLLLPLPLPLRAPDLETEIATQDSKRDSQGLAYRRTFFENGTARLERDGEVLPNFDRATWTVEHGVLTRSICHPDTDDLKGLEGHLLREDGTLFFLDRPYHNARRLISGLRAAHFGASTVFQWLTRCGVTKK